MGTGYRRRSDHEHQLDRQSRQARAPRTRRRFRIDASADELTVSKPDPTGLTRGHAPARAALRPEAATGLPRRQEAAKPRTIWVRPRYGDPSPRPNHPPDASADYGCGKTVAQSFLMLTTVQPSVSARSSDFSAPAVYSNSRSGSSWRSNSRRPCPAGATRVVQHRDVAVGVAAGHDRAAPDAAPDPHRLRGTVVEDVGLLQVDERSAVLILLVAEGVGAADHALGGDPVDLVRDRSHEVPVAARGDERREPVGL